jgi:hypothetical protein
LPIAPFSAILGSYGLAEIFNKIKNKLILISLFALLAFSFLRFDVGFILNPAKASFAPEDRHYLFEGDLSGIGVEETIEYIENVLKDNDAVLAVDSFWGQPDYIDLKINSKPNRYRFLVRKYAYFNSTWRIEPINRTKLEADCQKQKGKIIQVERDLLCQIIIPPELREETKTKKVFLLSLTERDNPTLIMSDPGIKLIKDIPRPTSRDKKIEHVYLYELSTTSE